MEEQHNETESQENASQSDKPSQETDQAQTEKDQGEQQSDQAAQPSPVEEKVADHLTTAVENVAGVDVGEEVKQFVSASKKLLDAIFSGMTAKFEQKINGYVQRILK